jgi:hypothetical protein
MCNAVELIFKKINDLDSILKELDSILKESNNNIDFLSNAGIGYDEVGKKYKLAIIYKDIVTLYKYNKYELNKDNGIYTNLKHIVSLYNESKNSNNHLLKNVVNISPDKYNNLKKLAKQVNDIRKSNYNSDILDTLKSTYDYMNFFDNIQKDIDSVGSYTVPDNWLWRILNFFKPFLDIYCEIYKDTNSKKIELSACKIQGGKISRNNKISTVFIRKQKFSDGVTRNVYRIGTSNYANYKKKLIKVRTLKKFLKRMKK